MRVLFLFIILTISDCCQMKREFRGVVFTQRMYMNIEFEVNTL